MEDRRNDNLERMRDAVDRKAEEARARAEAQSLTSPARGQDIDVRAKSSGHKKKTADKWNQ